MSLARLIRFLGRPEPIKLNEEKTLPKLCSFHSEWFVSAGEELRPIHKIFS